MHFFIPYHWLGAHHVTYKRGEEQNREEGEMAQTKLGGGRNRGKKVGRREKKKRNRLGRREKLAQKSREEGEISSESREKEIYPPVPPPLLQITAYE